MTPRRYQQARLLERHGTPGPEAAAGVAQKASPLRAFRSARKRGSQFNRTHPFEGRDITAKGLFPKQEVRLESMSAA
jgi:hypothetical protein